MPPALLQVFPKLKCFCYKNWFMMEQCRIPGDKETQFPLDCELDQVSLRCSGPGAARSMTSLTPQRPLSVCARCVPCCCVQWLRPKVLYNYGPNIVGKDGKRPFLFREHTLFTNPK